MDNYQNNNQYTNQGYYQQSYQQPPYQQPPQYMVSNQEFEMQKNTYNYTLLFVLSIIELFTCTICGIIALIFVSKMKSALMFGDYLSAAKYKKNTQTALIVGVILFVVGIILSAVMMAVLLPLVFENIGNYSHHYSNDFYDYYDYFGMIAPLF